jgi:hypothetical protein
MTSDPVTSALATLSPDDLAKVQAGDPAAVAAVQARFAQPTGQVSLSGGQADEPDPDSVFKTMSPGDLATVRSGDKAPYDRAVEQYKANAAKIAAGADPVATENYDLYRWQKKSGFQIGNEPSTFDVLTGAATGLASDLVHGAAALAKVVAMPNPLQRDQAPKPAETSATAIDTGANIGLNSATLARSAGHAIANIGRRMAAAFTRDSAGKEALQEASLRADFDTAVANRRDAAIADNFHEKFSDVFPEALAKATSDSAAGQAIMQATVDSAAARGLAVAMDPQNLAGVAAARLVTSPATAVLKGEINAGVRALSNARQELAALQAVKDATESRVLAGDLGWANELGGKSFEELTQEIATRQAQVSAAEAAIKSGMASAQATTEGLTQVSAARQAAGTVAQGAGKTVSAVGKAAGYVASLPADLAAKIVPENEWLQHKLADVSTGAAVYAIGSVTDSDAVKDVGLALPFHPVITQAGGDLAKLGELYAKGETVLPFWRQVRKIQEVSGLTKQAGAFLDNQFVAAPARVVGAAAKGALAGGVVSGAFGAVADSEDPGRGFASGFGAGGFLGFGVGALGQWGIIDNPAQRRAELDGQVGAYRNILAARPTELASFDKLSLENKRAVALYLAVHPDLSVRYVNEPGTSAGSFDPLRPQEIRVNVAAVTPLKQIVTHEIAHFVEDKALGAQVDALLLGDASAGIAGEFTARDAKGAPMIGPDGKFDTSDEFKAIRAKYETATKANPDSAGAVISDQDIAREIFAERHADYLFSDKYARDIKGYTAAADFIQSSPFLKNLLGRLGVTFDRAGEVIKSPLLGNLKKSPEIESLVREHYDARAKAKAGEVNPDADGRNRVFDEKSFTRATRVTEAYFDSTGEILRDTAGNPIYDSNGKAALRPAAEVKKDNAATTEALVKHLDAEKTNDPKAVQPRDDGAGGKIYSGRYLTDDAIAAVEKSGRLNPVQLGNLKRINAALKSSSDGQLFTHFYQAATKKGGGSLYRSLAGRWRTDLVYGLFLTKADNLVFQSISLETLHRNAQIEVAKGRATPWNNSLGDLIRDVDTYLDNLGSGQPGATNLGTEKRDFINNLLGFRVKKNGDVNPLHSVTNPPKTIITSLRLDRMNRVVPADGRAYKFDSGTYQSAAKNFLPDNPESSVPVTQEPGLTSPDNPTKESSSNASETAQPTGVSDAAKLPEGNQPPGGNGEVRVRSDAPSQGRVFRDALIRGAQSQSHGAAVDIKPLEFYEDPSTHLVLSPDENAGAAVAADKELVSVFKVAGSAAKIADVLAEASKKAAYLTAFAANDKLPNLYMPHGFRPLARVAFDTEQAPANWNYEKQGKPDFLVMINDPSGALGLPHADTYAEVKDRVPLVDYGEAMRLKDHALERLEKK